MEDYTDCILINHFKVSCEFSDLTDCLMVYMEWSDGSNFQFLGSLNSIVEWEQLKRSIELLCINRDLNPFDYRTFISQKDFYCHDYNLAQACEEYDKQKCKVQCDKCVREMG